ncbi:MAG: glycoside hydrolase 5 family protein [Gemmatimonadaceae bacterium]
MTFELGINYWPRRRAMYMWRELDIEEVRDDMTQMASIGFDVVRVFVLMEDFCPEPVTVDPTMVARLVDVSSAAKDAGLAIMPTLIVLNMSGRIWWPRWMLDSRGRPRDLYGDPLALASQAMLVDTCARALAGDASVRAYDLANEIDDAQRPQSRDDARRWMSRLADTVRKNAPGSRIQIGAHLPSLTTENNMRVDDLAAVSDENVMHAYPLYSDVARSFLDPELVPFSCAMTSALAGNARPTLMQEFGLCTAPRGEPGQTITDDFLGRPRQQYLASEDEAATYYDAVLERLARTGAAGGYAWCFGDYDRALFDRPPLATAVRERTFGLVRADGTEKPAVDVFRRFRQRRDAGQLEPAPVAPALDVSAEEYYSAPREHFARLYDAWLAETHV